MNFPKLYLRTGVTAILTTSVFCGVVAANGVRLQSPDGRLTAIVELTNYEDAAQCPTYSVIWNGRTILGRSRLGLDIEGLTLTEEVRIVSQQTSSHDSTWTPVCGERNNIRDHYNQVVITFQRISSPERKIDLIFRAYDTGVAYCYMIPEQEDIREVTVKRERSEFRFPGDHKTWVAYHAQADYQPAQLSEVKPGCERPLTIQVEDDLYLAVGEARLVDYARMKFAPLEEAPHSLVSQLGSSVRATLPLTTPWRLITVANSPGQLLEQNSIFLNLNDPCAIADTSWIKPGKVIREVTLTTAGGKACVDFAAKHGLQYVHFDAGWYGHEYDEASDATTVSVDPKRSKGPLDLHEVIAYAKQRGIEVIVYVNRRALEKQLDDILPLYKEWGIAGVKYGFVNVGSQKWTDWLHDAIRKAADHQLMVDVHDEYRPTGYERTYPNLMTCEGIAGDETSPQNTNTLTILFSRLLCGPADNTVCYYDGRVDKNATHAYQLAKAVCIYSPWQYLYWYDRPMASPGRVGGAGGNAGRIGDEPELAFFDALPASWDETRVIHARIGEYAVIARRRGDDWFIGAMNSTMARTLDVPLDFLPPNRSYIAHVYSDDPSVDTRTKVKVSHRPVEHASVLTVSMSAQGGQAIHLTPAPVRD